MSLGSVPCSCGGENPNCFKCWGTGMVESKLSPPKTKEAYRGARVATEMDRLPKIACPRCGKSVRGLEAHLRDVHGQASSNNKPTLSGCANSHGSLVGPKANPRPKQKLGLPAFVYAKLSVCSVCGAVVKNLSRHFNEAGHKPAPDTLADATPPSVARLSKGPSTLMACPKCNARFPNKTQLSSHVLGTHGRKAFFQLNFDDSRQWKNGGRGAAVGPTTNVGTQVDQGPSLDAKKHWGHSFRDHGQFGSYPSHDDMDDESSA